MGTRSSYVQGENMSLKTGWLEKRQSQRKEVKWDVTYQKVGGAEAQELRLQITSRQTLPPAAVDASSAGILQDLSLEGLAILSKEAIPSGSKVLFFLHVPGRRPSLVILAESVYSGPASPMEPEMYRSGLQILAVDLKVFAGIVGSL